LKHPYARIPANAGQAVGELEKNHLKLTKNLATLLAENDNEEEQKKTRDVKTRMSAHYVGLIDFNTEVNKMRTTARQAVFTMVKRSLRFDTEQVEAFNNYLKKAVRKHNDEEKACDVRTAQNLLLSGAYEAEWKKVMYHVAGKNLEAGRDDWCLEGFPPIMEAACLNYVHDKILIKTQPGKPFTDEDQEQLNRLTEVVKTARKAREKAAKEELAAAEGAGDESDGDSDAARSKAIDILNSLPSSSDDENEHESKEEEEMEVDGRSTVEGCSSIFSSCTRYCTTLHTKPVAASKHLVGWRSVHEARAHAVYTSCQARNAC
jgi:hypothetical protein